MCHYSVLQVRTGLPRSFFSVAKSGEIRCCTGNNILGVGVLTEDLPLRTSDRKGELHAWYSPALLWQPLRCHPWLCPGCPSPGPPGGQGQKETNLQRMEPLFRPQQFSQQEVIPSRATGEGQEPLMQKGMDTGKLWWPVTAFILAPRLSWALAFALVSASLLAVY